MSGHPCTARRVLAFLAIRTCQNTKHSRTRIDRSGGAQPLTFLGESEIPTPHAGSGGCCMRWQCVVVPSRMTMPAAASTTGPRSAPASEFKIVYTSTARLRTYTSATVVQVFHCSGHPCTATSQNTKRSLPSHTHTQKRSLRLTGRGVLVLRFALPVNMCELTRLSFFGLPSPVNMC